VAVPEFDCAAGEVLDHAAAVVVFELGYPGAVFSEDVVDLVSGDGGPGSRGVDVLGRGDLHSYSFRACVTCPYACGRGGEELNRYSWWGVRAVVAWRLDVLI